jgi:hypothetical protein
MQLDAQSTTLNELLRDVRSSTRSYEKQVGTAADGLGRDVANADQASSKASSDLDQYTQLQAADAGRSAEHAVGAFRKASLGEAEAATKAIESESQAAERQLAADQGASKASVEATAAAADGEVKHAAKVTRSAEEHLAAMEQSRITMDHKLETEFQAVEAKSAAAEAAFQAQIAKFGDAIGSLAAEDQAAVEGLQQHIASQATAVKGKVQALKAKDTGFRNSVENSLRTGQAASDKKALAFMNTVQRFRNHLLRLKRRSETEQGKAKEQVAAYEQKVGAANSRFHAKLHAEQKARMAATGEMLEQSSDGARQIQAALAGVSSLGAKVGGTVTYQLRSLQMQETKLAGQLAEALDLQQYQDKDTLQNLLAKARQVEGQNNQFDAWRAKADNGTQKFRELVQQEFKALGSELDMASVAAAEEQAMEEWALQEQMHRLKRQLGSELENMTSVAESRLTDLAMRSGAEIAALHRNATMSAKEKAAAIQAVQDRQRAAAQRILEEDGQLKLDQSTAARNLKVAIYEVERSSKQAAALDSGTPDDRSQAERTLDRVRSMVLQADRSLTEGGFADAAAENATSDATPAALLESVPEGALLQVATIRTAEALGDDEHWSRELDNLP